MCILLPVRHQTVNARFSSATGHLARDFDDAVTDQRNAFSAALRSKIACRFRLNLSHLQVGLVV